MHACRTCRPVTSGQQQRRGEDDERDERAVQGRRYMTRSARIPQRVSRTVRRPRLCGFVCAGYACQCAGAVRCGSSKTYLYLNVMRRAGGGGATACRVLVSLGGSCVCQAQQHLKLAACHSVAPRRTIRRPIGSRRRRVPADARGNMRHGSPQAAECSRTRTRALSGQNASTEDVRGGGKRAERF